MFRRECGRVVLTLESLEDRLLLDAGGLPVSPLGAPSVPFNDYFSDGTAGSVWDVAVEYPSSVWVQEANGRLEVRSDGSGSPSPDAFYKPNSWALDTSADWAFSVDWHFSASGGGSGTRANIFISVATYATDSVSYLQLLCRNLDFGVTEWA